MGNKHWLASLLFTTTIFMGDFMLRVNGVTKKYGKVLAVDNMSFSVEQGEVGVLLGPNGAGKSTIIKCIAGLLRYEGEVTICGYNNKSIDAKRVFSYIPETPALYDALTVKEHIEFIAKAYKLRDYEEYAAQLMERFDLNDKADKLGKELSKGMQQKVSICTAAIIKPKVIMFDEPMIGLDPKAIKELKKLFLELKDQGCSLLISTHIIDSIKGIWDKVLIMNKGKTVENRLKNQVGDENELEELFFKVTGAE